MSLGLVLDASITLAWAFDDEASDYVDRVLDHVTEHHAVVPAVWNFEIANGLAVGLRRSRLSAEEASAFAEDLARMDIRIDYSVPESMLLLADAIETGLTAYDAAYLALAREQGVPIATRDKAMAKAALAAGVDVF